MTPEAKAHKLLNSLPGSAKLAGYPREYDEAVAILATALAEARRDGLKEAAKVVNGLMGKDSGNWNRAIVYAEAAIRAKTQEVNP